MRTKKQKANFSGMTGKPKVSTVVTISPLSNLCLWVIPAAHSAVGATPPGTVALLALETNSGFSCTARGYWRMDPWWTESMFYFLGCSHWPAVFIGSHLIVSGNLKEMFLRLFLLFNGDIVPQNVNVDDTKKIPKPVRQWDCTFLVSLHRASWHIFLSPTY